MCLADTTEVIVHPSHCILSEGAVFVWVLSAATGERAPLQEALTKAFQSFCSS